MELRLERLDPRLGDSGLLSRAELHEFVESLPEAERPHDSESLLQALVRQGRLTAYQAREIGAGRGQNLVLGNYVVLDRLGQGGMGVVYKAQHVRMRRTVALKVLSPGVTNDADALRRFQREVVAAAKLTHPNIVAAYDADEARGTHFLVMEYMAGRNLGEIVSQTGPLSIRQAVSCLLQAARGLEYAHRQGVVHRDVKPSNLLVDATGHVKVLDLGLARLETLAGRAGAELTTTGEVMGTVDYMAPEQAESTRHADAKSDIYSLGMTLWYVLTGRPCFSGETIAARLVAHRVQPLPSLHAARPDAAPELEEIFLRLSAKNPAERYSSMTEAAAALEGFLRGLDEATLAVGDENELTARLASLAPREEPTVAFFQSDAGSTVQTDPRAAALPLPGSGSAVSGSAATRDRRPWALAAAFLGGAALIFLTVLLLLPKSGGNVLIEITDPEVRVSIDNGAVTIAGVSRKRLALASGEHELEVRRGETQLAEKFTVGQKGGVTLVIEVSEGRLLVTQDGQLLASVALESEAAQATPARQVLQFAPGAKVEVGSLKLDGNGSLTLEAYVTTGAAEGEPGVLLGAPLQFALHLDPATNRLSLVSRHEDGDHQVGPLEIERGRRLHLAAVRAGNEHRLYVEGILLGRRRIVSPLAGPAEAFVVGGQFSGHIEEVRVSSAARYEGSFTPEERFEPDAQTEALFHLAGTDAALVDASEKRHAASVLGATWARATEVLPAADLLANGTPHEPAASKPADESDLALSFNGEAQGVSIPLVFVPHDQPFTVECWARTRGGESHRAIIHVEGRFVIKTNTHAGGPLRWEVVASTETPGVYHILATTPIAPLPAKPVHLAAVYDGNSLSLFVDGQRQNRPLWRTGQAGDVPNEGILLGTPQSNGHLTLGAHFGQAGPFWTFDGTVDEVRLSTCARYQEDFTPSRRFEPDAQTLALYHCDEGAGEMLLDASGNLNHGRIVGASWARASGADYRPPPAPPAHLLDFAGADSVVDVPTVRYTGQHSLTLEAWVARRNPDATSPVVVLEDAESGQVMKLSYLPGGRISTAIYRDDDGAPETEGEYLLLDHPLPLPEGLVHVAACWDPAGEELSLFVNGLPTGEPRRGRRKWPSSQRMLLGAYRNADNQPEHSLDGLIDEVRVSRVVRYTGPFLPARRFEPDADTMALYHCDEGSGDTLLDASGNGHSGRLTGVTWRHEATPLARRFSGYALDFGFAAAAGHARVELPASLDLSPEAPHTVELFATSWGMGDPQGRMLLWNISGPLQMSQHGNRWVWQANSLPTNAALQDATSFLVGQRHHLAGVSTGEEISFFINGRRVGTRPVGDEFAPSLHRASLGGPSRPTTHKPFDGTIDAVRVSRGARYERPFEPPSRFETDAATLALYHFGEGTGETLRDSAGEGHHGRIVGAKWVLANQFETSPALAPLHSTSGEPIRSLPRSGQAGGALEFNGAGYVSVDSLEIDFSQPCTVEVVVTLDPAPYAWRWLPIVQSPDLSRRLGVWTGYDSKYRLLATQLNPEGQAETSTPEFAPPAAPLRLHMAAVYGAAEPRLFVNGRRLPVGTAPANFAAPQTIRGLLIGGWDKSDGAGISGWKGRIEELRVSRGVRYRESFQPSDRFESDDETLALYHFDEGSGDTLADSSGRGHHGKIVGARWIAAGALPPGGQDLLAGLDPRQDALVQDPADQVWKPGPWKVTTGGYLSGNERRELLRLPVKALPPNYSLTIEFEPAEESGALSAGLTANDTRFYLVVNGAMSDGRRRAGFGEVSGAGDHRNETTVIHDPLPIGRRHVLRVQVKSAHGLAEILAEVNGQPLTAYRGSLKRLNISEGLLKFYDGHIPKISVGSTLGSHLIHRVELHPLANPNPAAPPLAASPFEAPAAAEHQSAWAAHLGVPVAFSNQLGLPFRLVPPGEFEMGTTDERLQELLAGDLLAWQKRDLPAETPRHRVRISRPLYVCAHELTVKAFREFTTETGYKTEAETSGGGTWLTADDKWVQDPACSWKNPGWPIADDEPAVCLSLKDAQEFCRWLSSKDGLSYRVPTEAEWEYFARAGAAGEFQSGDSLTADQANIGSARRKAVAVGGGAPNAFGLFDVHGNAWERCSDWFDPEYYAASPPQDPTGPSAGRPVEGKIGAVLRGGGWHHSAHAARFAMRGWSPIVVTDHGVRIVAEIGAAPPPAQAPAAPAPAGAAPSAETPAPEAQRAP